MLSHFFLMPSDASQLLHVRHEPLLVVLSITVAAAASLLALHIVQAGQKAPGRFQRQAALLCGCATLGLGIWAMHFIGMLALHLPVHVKYDVPLTLASMLPGIFASWLALRHLMEDKPSRFRVAIAGLVVGIGIATMHYSGMAAMHMEVQLRYASVPFALSLLVAILMAIGSMLIWHRVQSGSDTSWLRMLLPSLLLALAISGMHYISMEAARFLGPSNSPGVANSEKSHELALLVVATCVGLFSFMALLAAVLRYRSMWKQVQRSEARLQAMADTAVDGVITIDSKGIVLSFNPAAEKMFGWDSSDVIGNNLNMLMPSPLAEQHDAYIAQHLLSGEQRAVGRSREVLGMHKDGRHVPLRLSIGQVSTPDGPIFVGFVYDLTERKRTEAQLRIAASVFDHTREGIAVVDANHQIVEVNSAFSRLVDLSRAKCLRMPFEEFYQNAVPPINLQAIWQSVNAQGHWQGEIILQRNSGTEWTQRLSLTAVLNDHKRLSHYVAVVSDVSLQARTGLGIEIKGLYDQLTGLPNELLLLERISHALPSAKRNQTMLAVVSMDFDHFSKVNEIHGRTVGDELITKMAQRVRTQLRGEDTLARGRNDELILLLAGLKDEVNLQTVLKRMHSALQQPLELSTIVIQISTSIGCAIYPQHGQTAEMLLASARQALEHSKPRPMPLTAAMPE